MGVVVLWGSSIMGEWCYEESGAVVGVVLWGYWCYGGGRIMGVVVIGVM